jgi:hypothetical protein
MNRDKVGCCCVNGDPQVGESTRGNWCPSIGEKIMKKRICASLASVAILTGWTGAASAANLISDGDFSAATVSVPVPASVNGVDILPINNSADTSDGGWTYSDSEFFQQEASDLSDYNVMSGSHAGGFGGQGSSNTYLAFQAADSSLDCIGQWIATTPGVKYTVSFWAAQTTQATGTDGMLEAFWGSNYGDGSNPLLDLNATSGAATAYQQYTFTETGIAGQDFSILEFHGLDANGAMLLDNVSVTAVPEPVSFSLVGSGLVLAGMRRRRRC